MNRVISSIKNSPFVWLSFALMLGVALSRATYVNSTDTLWQIRSGTDVLDSGKISYYDSYSWTMAGSKYISNSWLWNVTIGFLYRIDGIEAIVVLGFTLVLTIVVLLALLIRKNNLAWSSTFVGIALFGLFSNTWLTARPQLIDYLSIVLILLISKMLDFKKSKGLIIGSTLLFAIVVCWQNFHLSAPLGVVIIFFVVLDNLLTDSQSKIRNPKTLIMPIFKAGLVTLVVALGCFLTPYGLEGVTKGLDTSGASVGVIIEWMTPVSVLTDIGWYSVVSIILGTLALVQTWKTKKLAYFMLLVLMIALTSQQNRWSPFLALIALVPFLQFLATFVWRSLVVKLRPYLYAASAATAFIFLGLGSFALMPHDVLAGTKTGYTVAAHLPDGCKLFNVDETGGPIILFRPDIKVSADGRNDLYGRDKFIYYTTLGSAGSEEALTWLDQQQVTCAVTSPIRSLDRVLTNSSQWRMTYEDPDGFKVFVKEK